MLVLESRPKVDEMVRKAVAAGGAITMSPKTMVLCMAMDFKIWMGIWELIYMEPGAVQ